MKINELTNTKLDQYTKAANADYDKAAAAGDYKKSFKRASGMMKASGKKIDNDVKALQKARGVAEDKAGWSIKGSAKPAPKGPAPSWRLNPDGTATDKNTGVTYNKDGSVKSKEGVAEGAEIVDQDSDLDQQVYTLMVDGDKVSFTYWDYEDNFQNPDIKEIYQQAREQLGKTLSPEQVKAVARAVFKSFEQGVAEGTDDSVNYTLGHPVDKEYVYHIYRDGKKEGTYHSLDQAKQIVANMKRTSGHRKYKIARSPRSKMAGPQGQLPEGVAEGMFGIDSKTKGAIQNVVAKLSDIPGMWDFNADTFTDAGMDKLKAVLKNNPKHMKYAVNLTADDFDADLNENKFHPINDDDFYEYNVDTKEIVSRVSGKHPEARRFTSGMMQREWPGRDDKHKFIRGINAKYLNK